MAQQRGVTAKLMLGFESVEGTAPASGFTLPIISESLAQSRNKTSSTVLTGDRNPRRPFSGNRQSTGSITVPVDSTALPYWLYAAFGAPTTTGSGPYVHEFKVSSTQPSISLEKQFTDLGTAAYILYEGCKVQSASLNFTTDGEFTMTFNVAGATQEVNSSAFDASPTAVSMSRINSLNNAVEEGGAALLATNGMKSGSINMDFGLDLSNYVIGNDGTLLGIPEGILSVTGNIVTKFESTALMTKALNDTESSLKWTATESATSIFEVEVPELEYADNATAIEGPQGLVLPLDFTGFYENDAEASVIVFRITNSVASY